LRLGIPTPNNAQNTGEQAHRWQRRKSLRSFEGFGGQRGFPTTYVVTKDWKIYKKYLGMRANKKELIETDIEELLTQ
jgi:hypothetical protein